MRKKMTMRKMTMKIRTESLSNNPPFFLFLLVVVGSVIASIGILAMGQIVGKQIESVMLLHDYFTVLALMSGAGFVGLLLFSRSHYDDSVKAVKILAVIAVASVFIIDITGTIGYIEYRLPDPESPKSIIKETFPFAHEPMFETMEYAGLLGPMWAALIMYITWHYGEMIFTKPAIRNTLTISISYAIIYALFISFMGIVPAKIASVQG